MAKQQVVLRVPEEEFKAWTRAKDESEPIERWIRRSLNFMLAAEVKGTASVTLGSRRKLIREVGTCIRCGRRLVTRDPRARYCGDRCRVAAWRERQAE